MSPADSRERAGLPPWFLGLLTVLLAAWLFEESTHPTGTGWLRSMHPAAHRTHVGVLLSLVNLVVSAWAWGVGASSRGDLALRRWAGPVSAGFVIALTAAAVLTLRGEEIMRSDDGIAGWDWPVATCGIVAGAGGGVLGWRARAGAAQAPSYPGA